MTALACGVLAGMAGGAVVWWLMNRAGK